MILFDVDVLLHAYFETSPHHHVCREALESALAGPGPLGICPVVLSAVVRIGSNPRAFRPPATTAELLAFVEVLRAHEGAVPVTPGRRHWGIFRDLLEEHDLSAGDVTDAWLAALAMEHGAEWWTTDNDFDRFAALRARNLIA